MSSLTFNNGDPRLNKLITSIPISQPLPVRRSSQSLTSSDSNNSSKNVCVIGFPSDIGTARNGGRPGGFTGPTAFRRFLNSKGPIVNPEMNVDLSGFSIVDRGNVVEPLNSLNDDLWSNKLEQAHEKLYESVLEALQSGYFPFCIGGSNDQSYPNARALMKFHGASNVSVVNIDAHLDVRPFVPKPDSLRMTSEQDTETFFPHSGSPFRQLLEHEGFIGSNFAEFAVQGMQCSKEHADFVVSKGASIQWLGQIIHRNSTTSASEQFKELLDKLSDKEQKIFVSFDIDAVKGADAPGVSCPSPIGLSADDALEMAYIAGKHENVALFDISELCPAAEEYRTPMLAAFMFYQFMIGYSKRTKI